MLSVETCNKQLTAEIKRLAQQPQPTSDKAVLTADKLMEYNFKKIQSSLKKLTMTLETTQKELE